LHFSALGRSPADKNEKRDRAAKLAASRRKTVRLSRSRETLGAGLKQDRQRTLLARTRKRKQKPSLTEKSRQENEDGREKKNPCATWAGGGLAQWERTKHRKLLREALLGIKNKQVVNKQQEKNSSTALETKQEKSAALDRKSRPEFTIAWESARAPRNETEKENEMKIAAVRTQDLCALLRAEWTGVETKHRRTGSRQTKSRTEPGLRKFTVRRKYPNT
jgi:hypothetical protein